MNRSLTLACMRVAGYHSDTKAQTRLFIESRVSRTVADAEFKKGAAMRAKGVPCGCTNCAKVAKK